MNRNSIYFETQAGIAPNLYNDRDINSLFGCQPRTQLKIFASGGILFLKGEERTFLVSDKEV